AAKLAKVQMMTIVSRLAVVTDLTGSCLFCFVVTCFSAPTRSRFVCCGFASFCFLLRPSLRRNCLPESRFRRESALPAADGIVLAPWAGTTRQCCYSASIRRQTRAELYLARDISDHLSGWSFGARCCLPRLDLAPPIPAG